MIRSNDAGLCPNKDAGPGVAVMLECALRRLGPVPPSPPLRFTMLLSSLPVALQLMLYGLFQTPEAVPQLDFHLRHSHSTALNDSSRLIFSDVAPHLAEATEAFTIRTRNVRAHKPPSLALYTSARWGTKSLAWEEDHVAAPDVERRETLRQLAKMTSNAYYEPNNTAWYDLGPDWNTVCC